MKIFRLIVALVFLALAFLIPLYFERILFFTVGTISIGWVVSSILIRFLVIILFAISLKYTLKLFERTRRMKSIYVFLIAVLPGFGISFISPIYQLDYGMYDDGLKLENPDYINTLSDESVITNGKKSLVAFFTTTCPHCMYASEKLAVNLKAGQSLPVNAYFPGNEEDTRAFLTRHNGLEFNWFLIDDSSFIALSGGAFPSVFLINEEGTTEYHWTGDELNYSALDYLRSIEQ